MIETGRKLLRKNPDYQRLLAALGGARLKYNPKHCMAIVKSQNINPNTERS